MKLGGRFVFSAVAAIVLTVALDAQAASLKLQLLGLRTAFDAIALGSAGGHVILHKGDTASSGTAVYFDYQIGANGRVNHREKLSFQIWSFLSLAVDSQNEPHLLYWGLNGNGVVLRYATVASGKWLTQAVPNLGCGLIGADVIGSIVVDAANRVYIPCVWQQSVGANFASLIIFDGKNWSREDVATNRFDSAVQGEITPVGTPFATVDGKNAVHLGYELAGGYDPLPISAPYLLSVCDSVRQEGTYTERCYSNGCSVHSMAVGPGGDLHLICGDPAHYLHFDGTSATDEELSFFPGKPRGGFERYPGDCVY